jgi:radical S-adenosyl methionine domain-containing protein 2
MTLSQASACCRKSVKGVVIMYKELSVNFHLTERCNMACGYCFNHRHHTVRATPEQQQKIVTQLCHYGFSKISFVGGEPTLEPYLATLLQICKSFGKTTMLITNGSMLPQRGDCLKFCDWVGLSVDSLSIETNTRIGRRFPKHLAYRDICKVIHEYGCRLKVNTVVSRLNKDEYMHKFIEESRPERWKVLQVTKIEGQNDATFENFMVSQKNFENFVKRHAEFDSILVPESTENIIDSYLMLDHAGCFISNSRQIYQRSPSILEIGVQEALKFINFDNTKYINRNAVYNWS